MSRPALYRARAPPTAGSRAVFYNIRVVYWFAHSSEDRAAMLRRYRSCSALVLLDKTVSTAQCLESRAKIYSTVRAKKNRCHPCTTATDDAHCTGTAVGGTTLKLVACLVLR